MPPSDSSSPASSTPISDRVPVSYSALSDAQRDRCDEILDILRAVFDYVASYESVRRPEVTAHPQDIPGAGLTWRQRDGIRRNIRAVIYPTHHYLVEVRVTAWIEVTDRTAAVPDAVADAAGPADAEESVEATATTPAERVMTPAEVDYLVAARSGESATDPAAGQGTREWHTECRYRVLPENPSLVYESIEQDAFPYARGLTRDDLTNEMPV